jgi:hypothetical protein
VTGRFCGQFADCGPASSESNFTPLTAPTVKTHNGIDLKAAKPALR